MSNPQKRRRIDATDCIDRNTMLRVSNIILKLNLKQYDHILFDYINGEYNNNIDDIQSILSNLSNHITSFPDCSCGVDYMNSNHNANCINIHYNEHQDILQS